MNKYYVTLSNGAIEEVNCGSMFVDQGAIGFWSPGPAVQSNLVVMYAPGEWKIVVQEEPDEG